MLLCEHLEVFEDVWMVAALIRDVNDCLDKKSCRGDVRSLDLALSAMVVHIQSTKLAQAF